ncbi:MAG: hypothetical protein BHV67_15245 [Bacteroidales bacterium 43_36]|nr:MAG: hypothetical protein BHV67_15245 [Bacteroidales bacterium 43_36]
MIHDDLNFSFESSDFPVSIEEFAAYMDGNLSDDEMQRVSSVIEHDDTMQDVMNSIEQSELTLSEYTPDDLQLPKEIADGEFELPETDNHHVGGGGFFNPFSAVAACVAAPIAFDYLNDSFDEIEGNDVGKISDLNDNASSSHIGIMSDSINDNQISDFSNNADMNFSNDDDQFENGIVDDILN